MSRKNEERMASNNKVSNVVVFGYRSGTVNSKSFVSKVLLRIKWKLELH